MDSAYAKQRTYCRVLANAIRVLAIDGVEAAKSAHPGAPMGMADIAQVSWRYHLKHGSSDPHWPSCNHFVFSKRHSSIANALA
jgi:transketolase